MLRTRAVAVAAFATAALALSACGSDSLSTSSSPSGSASVKAVTVDEALAAKLPAKIKSAGKIVVGTDATYQPNEYLDSDGKTVIGMDVDLFNAVMAKFGIKTEWVPTGFDSIILGVAGGKYDVGVSSFSINADRLKQANMVSYFTAGTQFVTQKGNPKKIDPTMPCGLDIAVQKATVQSDVQLPALSKKCTDAGKPAIKPLVDADQAKVTAMVSSGKAAAMMVDLPPAISAVETSKEPLELLGEQTDSAPYGYVLPKAETDFAQAIVDALKALEKDGTYKEILTKWKTDGGAITDFAVNPSVS
jgi:polar amino acid transport system substrate-binding protein